MWNWIKHSLWRNALPAWLNWLLTSACLAGGLVIAEVGAGVPFNGWPGAAVTFFSALACALVLYPVAHYSWKLRQR